MNIIKRAENFYLKKWGRGKNLDVKEDYIFIVSYPKSGNTWVRFLIGNYLYDDFNFSNMENYIPDIYVVNNEKLKKLNHPRILKSHEFFQPKYRKTIYIVRDPRSVALSYFNFHKKTGYINNEVVFSDYLNFFIKGDLDDFGAWNENVKSWLCMREEIPDSFLFIRYEELKNNTEKKLIEIMNFLEISIDDFKLKRSLLKSSISNMKQDEIINSKNTEVLKYTKTNQPFVREGKIDEWKGVFSKDDLDLFENYFGELMMKLGYL